MNYEEYKKTPEYRKNFYIVDFGELVAMAILDLRVEHGMTQARLAKKTGMKQPAIARLEAGMHVPNPKTLARIAKAFDKQLVMRFKDI